MWRCVDSWNCSGRTGSPNLPALPHSSKILLCPQSLIEKDRSAVILVLCLRGEDRGARPCWWPLQLKELDTLSKNCTTTD